MIRHAWLLWAAGALGAGIVRASASPEPKADDGAAPGILWVRFDSSDFTRPSGTGVDARVALDTGAAIRDYSQRWEGRLRVPTDRPITVSAEADNGLRFYVDGVAVIDGWCDGDSRSGCFQGRAGALLPLGIDFFQNGGTAHARLFWSWEGHPKEAIPASAFFHTVEDAGRIRELGSGRRTPTEDRSVVYQPEAGVPGRAPDAALPIQALPGPHLLIDDYEIAKSAHVQRVVVQPLRDPEVPNPIVTGPGDHCFQPFFSVRRDPETQRFRIWYGTSEDNRQFRLATMDSPDGVHFVRPPRICETPEIQIGSDVIDRGAAWPDVASRYVYGYYVNEGLKLLKSDDGVRWQPLKEGFALHHDHDINSVSWDPLRERYVATLSTYMAWKGKWEGRRRVTLMSFSKDLFQWERPWYALVPQPGLDEGETQFYAMEGYLVRGGLRIAMVKVLRDDLRAAGTQPGSFGRAHTSLAWSRDGRTWVRDREKFFEPDDRPEAWDHAHAWIDDQLVVGDTTYLYYAGYRQGHKVNRCSERQIGLVKIPVDRYVARRGEGAEAGTLETVPIRLGSAGEGLCLNVNAAGGRVRVRVRDAESGSVVGGLNYDDCVPVTGNGVRLEARWKNPGAWERLSSRSVRLEFELVGADLFAFEFAAPPVKP